jgi:hypothetical protein
LKEVLQLGDDLADRVITEVVEFGRGETGIVPIDVYHPMVKTVCATKRTSPRCHNPHPSVLRVNHLLEIKDLIILLGEILDRSKWANLVLKDSAISPGPDVLYDRGVSVVFNGLDKIQEGLLPFSDAGIVKDTRFQDISWGHCWMHSSTDEWCICGGSDRLGDSDGVLKLVAHNREAHEIGRETLYIPYDSLGVERVPEILIDVQKSSDVTVLFQDSREVGNAVIEPNLRVQIGIDEENSHS